MRPAFDMPLNQVYQPLLIDGIILERRNQRNQ